MISRDNCKLKIFVFTLKADISFAIYSFIISKRSTLLRLCPLPSHTGQLYFYMFRLVLLVQLLSFWPIFASNRYNWQPRTRLARTEWYSRLDTNEPQVDPTPMDKTIYVLQIGRVVYQHLRKCDRISILHLHGKDQALEMMSLIFCW